METKRKLSMGAFLSTFVVVLLFAISINAVYAYFTSTAVKDYTINFATLSISLEDENGELVSETITEKIEGALPGDTIELNGLKVVNTGSTDAYSLIGVEMSIARNEGSTLYYKELYNFAGSAVNYNDFSANTTAATLIESSNHAEFSKSLTVPGDIGDDSQGQEITVKITAYAVQSYLPDADDYSVSEAVYASYFIVKSNNINNLFDQPYNSTQQYLSTNRTVNGIDFVVNADKSITVSGTLLDKSKNASFSLFNYGSFKDRLEVGSNYTIELNKEGGTNNKCYIMYGYTTTTLAPTDEGYWSTWHYLVVSTNNSKTFTYTADITNFQFYLEVQTGMETDIEPVDITLTPVVYKNSEPAK